MNSDKKFLVETLAESAERNRFTLGEFEQLLRLCLQLERDCPSVQFVIHEGNAYNVERDLLQQVQFTKQSENSHEKFNRELSQVWA